MYALRPEVFKICRFHASVVWTVLKDLWKIIERAEGKTQQEIAEVVDVSQQRVDQILQVNCAQAQKTCKETQTVRATQNNIHRRTQCRIDKIRTLNPTLADQCEAKNITVAKAERIVGIAPTPLEIAIKAYNRLTDADKKKFADYDEHLQYNG